MSNHYANSFRLCCGWPLRGANVFALFCLWIAANPARADLVWSQKTVELDPQPAALLVEGRFRFTNNGRTAVDIQKVETSCSCTTAALEQRRYEPGQTGEIVARYTPGEHTGLQKKLVVVCSSDHPAIPTTLTLVVRIPELVRVQPSFVSWSPSDGGTGKEIFVESVRGDLPLQNVTVESSNPAIMAELRTVLDGSKYEINITRRSATQMGYAVITIQGRVGTQDKHFRAYVSIQTSEPNSLAGRRASLPIH